MKIVFCTVIWNRLEEVKRSLRHHCPHVDESVVVDAGSTDGTREWLDSDEARNILGQKGHKPLIHYDYLYLNE